MRKPLLLGIDNPHSENPGAALLPRPVGSAGHRLFKMSGMTWSEYNATFDRKNMSDVPLGLRDFTFKDRAVIVLGKSTWIKLGFAAHCQPFSKMIIDQINAAFYLVPHPSGKNLFYNEPRNQESTTRLLRRIAHDFKDRARDAQGARKHIPGKRKHVQ